MTKLILASNSPRRQELLKQCGFEFEVVVLPFDEHFPDDLPAKAVAEYLAIQKNHHYRESLVNEIIITSDTTVIAGNNVLNKPANAQEASEMLSQLSGKDHEVITGVCISSADKTISFSETTHVIFETITDQEMQHYISKYEPFDKAGAYGIQEWIGMCKISSIKGSYFNVMGLPTHRVYTALTEDFGLKPN